MSPLYERRTGEAPKQLPQELLDEVRGNLDVKPRQSPPIGAIGEVGGHADMRPESPLDTKIDKNLFLSVIKKDYSEEIFNNNKSYVIRAHGSANPLYLPKGSIPNRRGAP